MQKTRPDPLVPLVRFVYAQDCPRQPKRLKRSNGTSSRTRLRLSHSTASRASACGGWPSASGTTATPIYNYYTNKEEIYLKGPGPGGSIFCTSRRSGPMAAKKTPSPECGPSQRRSFTLPVTKPAILQNHADHGCAHVRQVRGHASGERGRGSRGGIKETHRLRASTHGGDGLSATSCLAATKSGFNIFSG